MKTVQLIGGATSSEPIPVLEPGSERWGLNNLIMVVALKPRYEGWTRWFDLHPSAHIQGRKHNIYPWECKQTKPIVRFNVDPQMPASVAYPSSGVISKFGSRFFCSSFDWELALAIYEGFERVQLYGWRMAQLNYTHQVKSGQFWIKKALDAGIRIENYSKSSLFIAKNDQLEPEAMSRCLMYGLETTDRSKMYSHRWSK